MQSNSRHAVAAGFLGWTLDAFDFFVVVFLLDTLALQFGVPKARIILTLTATLALRPVGAIIFGQLSQKIGRRYSMIAALIVSLLVIPMWAFGGSLVILAAGAFLMQVGVQGAWGIIPIHLNELAPDAVRGLVPGLAYQFGILVAAPTNSIEDALRVRFGYSWALAGFEIFVMVALTVILLFGRENHGRSFHSGDLLIEKE